MAAHVVLGEGGFRYKTAKLLAIFSSNLEVFRFLPLSKEDPKRLFKLIILILSLLTFVGTLIYWVITSFDIAKMIGLTQ